MRFDTRGAKPAPRSIAVVGIDDTTLNSQGYTWPFSRKHYAKLIRQLDKAGAAVIAIDVQFTQPSPSQDADNALILAVRSAAPKVVLATTAVLPGAKTEIFGGGEGLKFSRAVPSYSNFIKDNDGVTRHLLTSADGLDSFAIAAAQVKLGHKVAPPADNATWIDFAGPPDTVPHLSFVDVEHGHFKPSDVKGKVVVIGATASALQDIRPTSTTGQAEMAGPEVHANAILTALAGFPLHSGPGWVDVLLVVLAGAAAPLAAIR